MYLIFFVTYVLDSYTPDDNITLRAGLLGQPR
jgi:hypothetical protein